jgi:hypothetical protein
MEKITYDGELDVSLADNFAAVLFNILDPLVVVFKSIGRDTKNLDIACSKVFSTTTDLTELGSANGREIARVGEEDGPRITDPFVELDRTCGGFSLKIWGDRTKAERRHYWMTKLGEMGDLIDSIWSLFIVLDSNPND